MMNERLRPGMYVKHFKRELNGIEDPLDPTYLYKIIGVAENTEDNEPMIVYAALYNDKLYVRPERIFYSEVDYKKYPTSKQKYRFEKISHTQWQEMMSSRASFCDEISAIQRKLNKLAMICLIREENKECKEELLELHSNWVRIGKYTYLPIEDYMRNLKNIPEWIKQINLEITAFEKKYSSKRRSNT